MATSVTSGTYNVSSGVIDTDDYVAQSGLISVSDGGEVTGATINGGSIEIKSSGIVTSGSLITISSGTLILDQAQNFSGTVAGASSGVQNIDLVNVSFTNLQTLSYTSSGGSGILSVTDGTTTAQLHLIGTYTVSSFHATVDGTGGTVITDPPVSNGAALAPH